MQSQALIVKDLHKKFGNVQAVNGLSFEVRKGEVFGLLGPNGAGKTTTIKMILGLLEPSQGEITVLGLNPSNDGIQIKRRVGYVAEEPMIFKSLTPKELFNFIGSVRRLNPEKVSKRLAELLESMNALEYYNRVIATLSHGNKQKVQLIAALLHDPDLLILDEPSTGLDAKSNRILKEIIHLHAKRGGAVIFCTHIMEIAQELCDRIAIVNKGQIVGIGTMDELRLRAKSTDKTLEDIFLTLTEADGQVNDIITKMRNNAAPNKNTEA